MKTYLSIVYTLFILVLSCKSANSYSDEQIKRLETLIESKSYTIESDWARPQVTYAMQQVLNSGVLQPGSAANAISLVGNTNFLTISGDSIKAYLPYFGERQINVAYGGRDSAIELDGLLKDYAFESAKHNGYLIKFKAKSKIEAYSISIIVYPNNESEIRVNSSSRFPISYTGKVERIDSD